MDDVGCHSQHLVVYKTVVDLFFYAVSLKFTACICNNNNNNHDNIYSAVIYGASHMREFTVVPLGQSRSAPGGRQLLGQAANLTFESACRLL